MLKLKIVYNAKIIDPIILLEANQLQIFKNKKSQNKILYFNPNEKLSTCNFHYNFLLSVYISRNTCGNI